MNQATPIDAKLTIEWLNKLIMLAQWDKKLPFHTVTLLSDPTAYQEFRTRVAAGTTDLTESTGETPIAIARGKLLAAVASVPALKELFAAEPDPFKDAPPDHLQLLAEVSDITVKPPQMIYSRNGTLIAVVEALRQSQQLNADSLIVDGLNKFFTLIEENEPVAEMLFELAKSPHWYVVLASLREDRDYTRDEEPPVGQTLRDWQAKLTPQLRKSLFQSGHLSRAPKKLVQLAWTQRQLFAEARQKLPADAREHDDPVEERRQVANEAMTLFEERAKLACDEIKADLNVLATVARHYINVRKFAKLDGFVYTWPEIARLAMSNYSALKFVEDMLVNRKTLAPGAVLDDPDAQDLYNLCKNNDRLIRFLRLRPYFSEINEDELRLYQPLAPVVVTDTPQAVGSTRGADFPTPQPQPPSPPPEVKPLKVLDITIEHDENAPLPQQGNNYKVTLVEMPEGASLGGATVTFSVQKLLERILGAMGLTSDAALHEVLRELFSGNPTLAESRMARGGAVLAKQLLMLDSPELGGINPGAFLAHFRPLRVLVSSDVGDMHYLPWEWLTSAPLASLWLSNPDFSLVRTNSPDDDVTAVALYPPVRILSVFPDPPSGERASSDVLVRAIQGVAKVEGVHHRWLAQSQATLGNMMEALNKFSPHIVHFEGYLSSTAPEGVVRLAFPQTDESPITVEQFGYALKESGVQLLVIGKNTHRHVYDNTGAAAAFLLSGKGLPAIIAPMRAIDEQSSLIFTTEFYSEFLKGIPLEAALHTARRRTAAKGGDWSVFALFADPHRLDDFQVLRENA